MKLEEIQAVADAVLYEGYLLYPYRHSAIKNRQRWTYGVVYPRAYSEAGGGVEPCNMETGCLLTAEAGTDPLLDVHVRFLHLMRRRREQGRTACAGGDLEETQGVAVVWRAEAFEEQWEEGVERTVSACGLALSGLLVEPRRLSFSFPARRLVEQEEDGAATIIREQWALAGQVEIAAEALGADLYRLQVSILNTSALPEGHSLRAQEVLFAACVSTHTILQVRGGAFVSLIDPPEELRPFVAGCRNSGTWPVLVGQPGERDSLLSSPIILYDYPQIAPESPGPLFDGTEIDELLTLRIMTLTDEEKEQIRRGDERARAILERAEQLSPEQLMQLHGTIRGLRPLEEER
jgi:hypothetical protein